MQRWIHGSARRSAGSGGEAARGERPAGTGASGGERRGRPAGPRCPRKGRLRRAALRLGQRTGRSAREPSCRGGAVPRPRCAAARVVVGVDGSARSLSALRWAAAEARTRDAELDVVHAWQLPAMAAAPVMAAFPDYPMEEAGHAILDAAVAEPALADTRVHPHFVRDSPAGALITRVCGRRTGGGRYPRPWRVAGALLGSVSRQLLHHAPCPVVII